MTTFPRCKKCGHDPVPHGMTYCTHRTPVPWGYRECDCTGWVAQ